MRDFISLRLGKGMSDQKQQEQTERMDTTPISQTERDTATQLESMSPVSSEIPYL